MHCYYQERVRVQVLHMVSTVTELGRERGKGWKMKVSPGKHESSSSSLGLLTTHRRWVVVPRYSLEKVKVQAFYLAFAGRDGDSILSEVYVWRRAECLKVFYLSRLILQLESKFFLGIVFCLYSLAFPGCWLLQCPVWAKKKTRGIHHHVSWVLRSLAHLTSSF